MIAASSFSDR